jgi:lauroyl/myristoyl acyltransferase
MPSRPRRNFRTAAFMRLASLAPLVPDGLSLGIRPLTSTLLRAVPGPRAQVRANMALALGPDGFGSQHVRAYYDHLADMVALSTIIFRSGSAKMDFDRFIDEEPESRRIVMDALSLGKGAILAVPHLIGNDIMAARINREVPITALVRQSPDAEYEALKQRYYRQVGLEIAQRPRKGAKLEGLQEMMSAVRVLRKNRVLSITPDLLRAPGTGVPVRLFNRVAEIPAGPFFLSARTGSPIIPAFFHHQDGKYRLRSLPTINVSGEGDVEKHIAEAAQQWTGHFEAFLRKHPDMWQFWLDKRWSQWLRQPA